VQVLGVAGSPAPGRLTTTFQLGADTLIDTGAAPFALAPERWVEIRHVLLSHAHLDHTLGLPFLAIPATPRVYGLQTTLDAVRESLLDGRIWPDLSERIEWVEIEEGMTVEVGGRDVAVGPADHTVPCLSFSVGGVVVVGDTRFDDRVVAWAAAQRPGTCIVECSFPDESHELAVRLGHQTPLDLRRWREALGPDCILAVTHLKPEVETVIQAECEALGDPRLRILHDGDEIE